MGERKRERERDIELFSAVRRRNSFAIYFLGGNVEEEKLNSFLNTAKKEKNEIVLGRWH